MAAAASERPPADERFRTRTGLARTASATAVVFAAFYALDAWLVATVRPELGYAAPAALRLVGIAGALAALSIARADRHSDRAAAVAHGLLLALAAVQMAVSEAALGGPGTVYVHGLAVLFVLRAAFLPSPVRQSFAYACLLVFTHAATLLAYLAWDAGARALFADRTALVQAATNELVMLAVVTGSALASRTANDVRDELLRTRRIGRYRLEAILGRGGQGEVWLAWDAVLARQVALKLLPPDPAGRDARALFEREAVLASQLRGPNAVRVYDVSVGDDGFSYMAMEYVDGEDLSTLVATHGPMPVERAIHFALQACDALAEAHALGLVHRDVKPSNLRALRTRGEYDRLKLLDFGIAVSRGPLEAHRAGDTTRRGTPAYMAPELLRGAEPTVRTDVYALGATLHHLLAGAAPFAGDDAQLVTSAVPPPIAAQRGAPVAEDVQAVVSRCLASTETERFADVHDLRKALEGCADCGRWTTERAEAFWVVERTALVQRYEAATLT